MHAFEEEPEVLRVNSRRDAMSQVCDPRSRLLTAFETPTHPLNLPLNRFLPTVQHVRIQVPLERNAWADDFPSNGRVDAPVQPDYIVTACPSDAFQGGARSLWKEGEGNDWKSLNPQPPTNFSGDVSKGG